MTCLQPVVINLSDSLCCSIFLKHLRLKLTSDGIEMKRIRLKNKKSCWFHLNQEIINFNAEQPSEEYHDIIFSQVSTSHDF